MMKKTFLAACCAWVLLLNTSAETVHLDVGSLQGSRTPEVAAGAAGAALMQTESAMLQWTSGTPISVAVSYSGTVKPTGTGGQFSSINELSATETVEAYLNGLTAGGTRDLWGDSVTGEGGNSSMTFTMTGFEAGTVYRVRLLSLRRNGWYGNSGGNGVYSLTASDAEITNSGWIQEDAAGTGNVSSSYPVVNNGKGVMTASYPGTAGVSGLCQYLAWEFRTPKDGWDADKQVTLKAQGNFCIAGVGVTREPGEEDPVPGSGDVPATGTLIANPVELDESDVSMPSSGVLWHNRVGEWKDSRPQGGTGDESWANNTTPIGNGRLGALIYGGCGTDHLELTEISLWGGAQCSVEDKGANNGKGPDSLLFGSYQPFATLAVNHYGTGTATAYRRALDLKTGVASVSFQAGGTSFLREYFASAPDQVIVMTETADKAGALNVDIRISSLHTRDVIEADASGGVISQRGSLANGVVYEGRYRVLHQGGTLTANADGSLTLSGADSMTVLMSMGTNYVMDKAKNWQGGDPAAVVAARVNAAAALDAAALKEAHIRDYQSLYNRASLDLGTSTASSIHYPVNTRMQAYRQALSGSTDPADPELEALLFDFGRYLIISSSREGNLPGNLQGLWNYSLIPPWDGDYHNNINVEMCYWAPEIVNLGECNMPLMDFIEAMAPSAREITKKQFGAAVRGWTSRTAQNIFGGQGFKWNTPASAWYMLHMWEWYQFSGDKHFLKERAYPMMKEICHFWEDRLKTLEAGAANFHSSRSLTEAQRGQLSSVKAGTLVAPDGWSPEHGPTEDGVAHDQQIIWELFDDTIQAARILGADQTTEDREWIEALAVKRDLLDGPRISSSTGRLQEWMVDGDVDTGHRHTSHLFAVYPGRQISPNQTPELAAAARLSLVDRGTTGDARRSWTWAWRCNLWARFQEGNKAREMIQGLISHNMLNSMFTTHPPMQIDGNLGIVAGIAEMLIQSHNKETIHLLPALPDGWPSGSVKGFKARGNVTVDFSWKDGKVTSWRLASPTREPVLLKLGREDAVLVTPASYHDPAVPLLTVVPGSWTAPAGGGSLSVAVSSNEPWLASVQAGGEWMSLSRTSGDSGDETTLTASANAAVAERRVDVTFSTSSSTQTVTIVQEGTPALTGYEKWKKTHFPAGTEADDMSPGANPAGDGITNLMKYATGLDPLNPSGSVTVLTVAEEDGKRYLALSWPVNQEADDVVFSVESSGDLKTWNDEGKIKPSGAHAEYRDATPMDENSSERRFLRLKVEGGPGFPYNPE